MADASNIRCVLDRAKLKRMAAEYTVSLHAAALRIHYDLKLWKCAIGMWCTVPRPQTVWFVGPRRWDDTMPHQSLLEPVALLERTISGAGGSAQKRSRSIC